MKKVFLPIIMLLVLPAVFAEITIKPEQSVYNLGNRIKASISVVQPEGFEGLFRLALACGNYRLQYFLTPITLEANFMTAIDVPEVAATSQMLGECTITADLLTNDNLVLEEKVSNTLSVTDVLGMLPVRPSITALPGEPIRIVGVVNEAAGTNVLKATTQARLDEASYSMEATDGKFNFTIDIPKNIKSGKHSIELKSFDQKNNLGSSSIELFITAVPSYVKTEISSNSLLPGSKVEITPSIYDQADDLINASIDLEMTSPSGQKVFTKVVTSNEKLDYEFSQYGEPGIYSLDSSYKGLHDYDAINITSIREVKIKFENETVFIENIGNIPFVDELTFFIQSEAKKYPILKKINVDPGRILDIDLSREVPLGIYDVVLPFKEGLEPAKEALGKEAGETAENMLNLLPQKEKLLADDVTIHDNRPAYKKIATSLSSVSWALVGADGVLAKNPIVAPVILLSILSIIVFRYGRKPIMKLIRGRKEDKDQDEEKR